MKLLPLTDRVVIKRAEEKEGIIIIPDAAKKKPAQGEVVAVGPGRRNEAGKLIPTEVQVGDQVLFGKYSATEIEVGGEELLVISEDDILGVLG